MQTRVTRTCGLGVGCGERENWELSLRTGAGQEATARGLRCNPRGAEQSRRFRNHAFRVRLMKV